MFLVFRLADKFFYLHTVLELGLSVYQRGLWGFQIILGLFSLQEFVGNKEKGRISKQVFQVKKES